ncbi:hypothetical protein COLO4_12216 [Corchorus olitorius]|uniref:Uncharacterized protein n=1 Tax=Corchorus olitorius TaxID=93759 RepID=A0A1R3K1R2_9ROSI|nr:hypothetical protein COLO4_12216 [Corchorus olitorius]
MREVFEEYSKAVTPRTVAEASGSGQRNDISGCDELMIEGADIGFNTMDFFLQHQKESGLVSKKSELDIYLQEEPDKVSEAEFDLLMW